MQAQERLRQICTYACSRKETSRAGSVLILRFFHDYYPSEIAKVLCSSRHSVDEWQRLARRELKLYLTEPGRLRFVAAKASTGQAQTKLSAANGDLIGELRRMIFRSRQGDCPPREHLQDIYQSGNADTTDRLDRVPPIGDTTQINTKNETDLSRVSVYAYEHWQPIDSFRLIAGLAERKLVDLFDVAEEAALANGRARVFRHDLPLTKGLQAFLGQVEPLARELELEPLLVFLADAGVAGPLDEMVRAEIPRLMAALLLLAGRVIAVIEPENMSTLERLERLTRSAPGRPTHWEVERAAVILDMTL